MRQLAYLNKQGDFTLRDAQRYGEIYFPLVNEGGMMSSVTPLLAGDCKSGQNTFLLPPASEDSLRSGRDNRNFWVRVNGGEPWSVTGQSAPQQARRFSPDCEETVLTGGLLWQQITRENRALGLRADTRSFVPAGRERIEIMQVTLTNTGDARFDAWMRWVAIQPVLRRMCGCSFLPHHDYGRGGRGCRDLWQDSLALLLADPRGVREDLLSYFAGVRTDGTNATIIGAAPGEFKADRNGIPRVWMDHGFWPLLTVALYLDETGDDSFLVEERPYFADDLPWRGEWTRSAPPDSPRVGTVLEHLLVQLAAAFFDVGEHGHMRLRGADWNDGLDMARERGESVAFTVAYAHGFSLLAGMVKRLAGAERESFPVSKALAGLLNCPEDTWGKPEEMRAALLGYCARADRTWEKVEYPAPLLSGKLHAMARWLREHIAATEWVGDGVSLHWFNSYYDNSGRQAEGLRGETARMMLTGQVFAILSGTADEDRVRDIVRAADWYLFQPQRGGYCLNTDFGEVKLDMGRMFGFAYGHKENGAVFCHMAVMYAYALYARGFAAEGWKVLRQLFLQCDNFDRCRLLPSIPEYFDDRGRGMYPYLTGAGSWLLLTMQTQVFGVRGQCGDLLLEPKLTSEQFDANGRAKLCCTAAGRRLRVRYINAGRLDWGQYRLGAVVCGDRQWMGDSGRLVIPQTELPRGEGLLELTAELVPAGEGDDQNV